MCCIIQAIIIIRYSSPQHCLGLLSPWMLAVAADKWSFVPLDHLARGPEKHSAHCNKHIQ